MPTAILGGPVNGVADGTKVCTLTGGTLLVNGMKAGPDGDNWVVYADHEIAGLAGQAHTYRHAPRGAVDHICSGKGTWAFEVFASSRPHAVSFFHIRPPAKLVEMMGSDPDIVTFTGADLLQCYTAARDASRAPRVWRRNVIGWDEIAVNFCMKHA